MNDSERFFYTSNRAYARADHPVSNRDEIVAAFERTSENETPIDETTRDRRPRSPSKSPR
ncbi:hypothetical protein B1756_11055 [Natrarchaeobaculum aegyptiacum]|uniref:Uncharacterized protein n=1 Tax=Natrarchaeobaculum aegyptiacum TaxID=745377 RepID=A0A2Z2HSR7_9EURY|nr:hypothetical protein B1756_11055 [Natrarchaeobaculum aegyptiacum]